MLGPRSYKRSGAVPPQVAVYPEDIRLQKNPPLTLPAHAHVTLEMRGLRGIVARCQDLYRGQLLPA